MSAGKDIFPPVDSSEAGAEWLPFKKDGEASGC